MIIYLEDLLNRRNIQRDVLHFFYHGRLSPRDQAAILRNARYRQPYERKVTADAERKRLSTLRVTDEDLKAHRARVEARLHAGAEIDIKLAGLAWEILGQPEMWEIWSKPEKWPGRCSSDGSEAEGWWLGL